MLITNRIILYMLLLIVQSWANAYTVRQYSLAEQGLNANAVATSDSLYVVGTEFGIYTMNAHLENPIHWTTGNGLALNDVSDVAIDQTGDIWAVFSGIGNGSKSTLSQYHNDTWNHVTYDERLQVEQFNALIIGSDSAAWIAGYDGVYRFKDNEWFKYILLNEEVLNICEDENHQLWAHTNDRLYQFDLLEVPDTAVAYIDSLQEFFFYPFYLKKLNQWTTTQISDDGDGIASLHCDSESVMLGNHSGVYTLEVSDSSWTQLYFYDAAPITSITRDAHSLVVLSRDGIIHRYADSWSITNYGVEGAFLFSDTGSALSIGTVRGLYNCNETSCDVIDLPQSDLNVSQAYSNFDEDTLGVLRYNYFNYSQDGWLPEVSEKYSNVYTDNAGRTWRRDDTLFGLWNNGAISSATIDLGTESITGFIDQDTILWLSTNSGLYRYHDLEWESFSVGCAHIVGIESVENDSLVVVCPDKILIMNTNGQRTQHPDGAFVAASKSVTGELVVATNTALIALSPGVGFDTLIVPEQPIISDISFDNAGVLWITTWRSGAWTYHDSIWTHYTSEDGLAHNYLKGVYTTERGDVWFQSLFFLTGFIFNDSTPIVEPISSASMGSSASLSSSSVSKESSATAPLINDEILSTYFMNSAAPVTLSLYSIQGEFIQSENVTNDDVRFARSVSRGAYVKVYSIQGAVLLRDVFIH